MEVDVIEVRGVTKRFRGEDAVDGVSFTAPAGQVTGFLGPNGAGKTTTIRMLLGLARPDAGEVRIDGRSYAELRTPRREVGAVLDSIGFHPGRTGRNHLRILARAAGIDDGRVDQVLELVDLTPAATRKVGGYSLGMRQRLALAGALLGDPPVLILDEPANGLDPAGMAWLRGLIATWADQGRTVLVSSHVLAEVAQVADRVVIIDSGRIVREAAADELAPGHEVVVQTNEPARLASLATDHGWQVRPTAPDRLTITGTTAGAVGEVAAAAGIALGALGTTTIGEQLEDVFLAVTGAGEEVAP
jgi:ABC-2 type transport system ATP-binding protein